MVIAIVVAWTALVWVLVATGVLSRWTTWMKLSPLAVYLLAMAFLFIPMESGAPAGPLTVMAYSVQVAPNVSGVVTDVPIKAGIPVKKGDTLFKIDPTAFAAKVEQTKVQLSLANTRLEQKKTLVESGSGRRTEFEQAESDVKALSAQLEAAEWELEQTIIRSPSDGYVPNQSVQPGARVNAGVPVMPFLESTRKAIALQIPQNGYRHIRAGQPAEVVFELYPGQVFPGKVKLLVPANASGQLTPNGLVALIKTGSEPFLVELELDKDLDPLPPGAVGTGAVYTDHLRITHPVRRVMLRGGTWLNFI
jgi:RND family efflux transporter MFP subunit